MKKNNIIAIMIVIILIVAGGLLYFFYGGNQVSTNTDNTNQTQNQSAPNNTDATSSQNIANKTFTAAQLALYNGQNGQPAYVAVDGLVYDLSPIFKNGNHRSHNAGQDLSAEFHNQHNSSMLGRFKVIGTYTK